MRGAIWAAYSDTDALSTSCPNCGALPGRWCTKPDGRVRRIPCVARATAAIGTGDGKPYIARDFSLPTYPTDREDQE